MQAWFYILTIQQVPYELICADSTFLEYYVSFHSYQL